MSVYALKCFINEENLQKTNVLKTNEATVPVRSCVVNVPVHGANVWQINVYMEILESCLILNMFSLAYMIFIQVYI